MYKSILFFCAVITLVSCKNTPKPTFSVEGVISNSTARKVYLEEVPAIMQPALVDSAAIGKDGKFSLKASPKESVVYNLRLDQGFYPIVSVINDVPAITLDIRMNKQDNQFFTESYVIKGSPVSQQMKEFMTTFNNDLQKIFITGRKADSLRRAGMADSVVSPLIAEKKAIADKIKKYSEQAFSNANDPALLMFELGFYQEMANEARYGIEPLQDEQVNEIVSRGAKRFPLHNGIAAVNAMLERQMESERVVSLVGREAPDFSLPDVNGKEVKLSSFRGKYVLVDFWASWCMPCRQENPNVVQAYQRYKDKNFTVLGVSLDRPGQKEQWLKAIEEDKLAWTHVSDLQFWSSAVVPLYHLKGIPFNILVDPGGKVVAQGLRGQGLDAKLAEVLR